MPQDDRAATGEATRPHSDPLEPTPLTFSRERRGTRRSRLPMIALGSRRGGNAELLSPALGPSRRDGSVSSASDALAGSGAG